MSIFKFIFYLGIISVVLNWLWGVFSWAVSVLLKAIGVREGDSCFLMRLVGYILLVSISALLTIHSIENFSTGNQILYSIIGAMVVYMNVAGSLNRKRMIAKIKGAQTKLISEKNEKFIVLLAMILFVVILYYPMIAENDVTALFQKAIEDIYDIPVINWIIAIGAFFFMIRMILNGVALTMNILFGKPENPKPFGNGVHVDVSMGNKTEDTDYEEVKDEEK